MMNYAQGKFMTALSLRKAPWFYQFLGVFVAWFLGAVPLAVFYRYVEERLSLRWREWMTQHLIKRYFYQPRLLPPAQRLGDRQPGPAHLGGRAATSPTTDALLLAHRPQFASSPSSASSACCGSSPACSWSSSLVYAVVRHRCSPSSSAGGWCGLHFHQYKREADFRYGLVRVRDNAESIAFYRGEKREHRDLQRKLDERGAETRCCIIGWNRNLAFFTTSYNYARAHRARSSSSRRCSCAARWSSASSRRPTGAFAPVLAAVSHDHHPVRGPEPFTAGITPPRRALGRLDEYDAEDARARRTTTQIEINEDQRRLKLDDLTVHTPERDQELTRELIFSLPHGEEPAHHGRERLGQELAAAHHRRPLDSPARARSSGHACSDMIFLPQRPYMVPGQPARAARCIPRRRSSADDDALQKILKDVNLEELLERDGRRPRSAWSMGRTSSRSASSSACPSPGCSDAKPLIAFLDEATSALDEPNEEHLYKLVRESGVTYVSVGHRSTLRAFHDRVIDRGTRRRMDDGGSPSKTSHRSCKSPGRSPKVQSARKDANCMEG